MTNPANMRANKVKNVSISPPIVKIICTIGPKLFDNTQNNINLRYNTQVHAAHNITNNVFSMFPCQHGTLPISSAVS